MLTQLFDNVDGLDVPAIYEITKIGFPRATCYDASGIHCKLGATGTCSLTGSTVTPEAPRCNASQWLNKLGAEMTQFGGYGGSIDQVNYYLQNQIDRRAMDFSNDFMTALTQHLTDTTVNGTNTQGARNQFDMAFQNFFGKAMNLVKFAANMGILISYQNIPSKEDIELRVVPEAMQVPLSQESGRFDENFKKIDAQFAQIGKALTEDDEPVSATISRKEVKRLRKRIQKLEAQVATLADGAATAERCSASPYLPSSRSHQAANVDSGSNGSNRQGEEAP